ncbi:hypothetical protein PaecuDRAFT_2887 [Paenibacillus curdlanolyticus YK9]|uniref:Uncharacterized protein n=2 Tax=Paenibacillus curdlanolyticus TaxID=59840 RepID=E0IAP7_9BACL|nr:hypothetical protein PaecuDRAFT_2887 [Paenibacillus curdlanolyticus YK9]
MNNSSFIVVTLVAVVIFVITLLTFLVSLPSQGLISMSDTKTATMSGIGLIVEAVLYYLIVKVYLAHKE